MEFLRRFRSLQGRRAVPVVMVTAEIEVAGRHEALPPGGNDFLTKPVNAIEFKVRIGKLVALRQAEQQLAARADSLAEAVRLANAAIVAREHEAIHSLSRAAEFHDNDTGSHLLRMAAYTRLIAPRLGLEATEYDLICDAAPMHDIGKVGIPDALLLKPGALRPDECAIMQRHPQIRTHILEGSEYSLLQAGALITISHHERFDGGGCPQGSVGTAIPLYGRIAAVADVFDAPTKARAYKPSWELALAVEYSKPSAVANSTQHVSTHC